MILGLKNPRLKKNRKKGMRENGGKLLKNNDFPRQSIIK